MKLAWSTDIHLNFIDSLKFQSFCKKVKETGADAALVTGDISEGDRIIRHLTDMQNGIGMPLYFVLGNHDFYRSSVHDVRRRVKDMCAANPLLHWLRETVVELTPNTALVGVDGWADAKRGLPHLGRLGMADWQLIEEYKHAQAMYSVQTRMQLADQLGKLEAIALQMPLTEAAKKYKRVIIATHIPPFKEATWHMGKHSDDDWLPWFSCIQVGEVLSRVAEEHPTVEFVTYCGHTHGKGVYRHSPNLVIYTGSAAYNKPKVNGVLEVP